MVRISFSARERAFRSASPGVGSVTESLAHSRNRPPAGRMTGGAQPGEELPKPRNLSAEWTSAPRLLPHLSLMTIILGRRPVPRNPVGSRNVSGQTCRGDGYGSLMWRP
jgi:hypothetical protein